MTRVRVNEDKRAVPMRACAACRQRRPAAELVRFVAVGSSVQPDLRRIAPGRGVNLCPTRACLERALRRSVFGRAFGRELQLDPDDLVATLRSTLMDALLALLADARRSGDVVDVAPNAVVPPELKALRDRSLESPGASGAPEVPSVAVLSARHRARVAWLAEGIAQFTFPGSGDMNRRHSSGVRGPGRSERQSSQRSEKA